MAYCLCFMPASNNDRLWIIFPGNVLYGDMLFRNTYLIRL
jgi:hypothetical protein